MAGRKLGEFCLGFVIGLLTDKAPRVKWEATRVIGNVAKEFPEQTAKAIGFMIQVMSALSCTQKGDVALERARG